MSAALALTSSARAQGRVTRENVNAWFTVSGESQVRAHWFVDYEANLRWSGPFDEWMQVIPRVSIRHQPRPTLRFNWGYNAAETWAYGKLPAATRFPERRMWEQVQFTQAFTRFNVLHRYRLEQRWQGRVTSSDGQARDESWVRTNRMRYRVLANVPLRGPSLDDGEFYTNLGTEVMVNWGANIGGNVFDQHRMSWMLGYRLSRHLRLEAGFMEQLTLRANGRSLERNHTLMFTVLPSTLLPG